MASRASALLLSVLALSTSACAEIWGFKNLSESSDAGAVIEAGSDFDAGSVQPDSSVVNQPDAAPDAGPAGCQNTLCRGKCVDIMTSHENCNGCDNKCATGGYCQQGVCNCPMPESVCGTQCLDFSTDSNNCGGCMSACPPGSYCQNGLCVCGGAGGAQCKGACVSTYYDPTNCGACGTTCLPGIGCQPSGCGCTPPMSTCTVHSAPTCVNTNADPNNCGTCGKACPPGADCNNGLCVCSPAGSPMVALCGATDAGVPGACAELTVDSNNCGSCGNSCGGGTHCRGGNCVCSVPLSLCAGTCVDEKKDRDHCGACSTVCLGVTSCVNGVCQ